MSLEFFAMASNTSSAFTSVLANSKIVGANISPQIDNVLETITNIGAWQLLATILAVCVVYDQGV